MYSEGLLLSARDFPSSARWVPTSSLHSAVGNRGGERCVKGTFQFYISRMTENVWLVLLNKVIVSERLGSQ
jgi:hypothetical protein